MRREAINRPTLGVVHLLDAGGRERSLDDDVLLNVLHTEAREFFHDDRSVFLEHAPGRVPVLTRTQVRRVDEDIESLATDGRLVRVGSRGRCDIERRIPRGDAFCIDILELLV